MCNSGSLKKALTLKSSPPGNDFLNQCDIGIEEKTYPLELYFCQDCYHIQLGHVVDPKILYQKNSKIILMTTKNLIVNVLLTSERV